MQGCPSAALTPLNIGNTNDEGAQAPQHGHHRRTISIVARIIVFPRLHSQRQFFENRYPTQPSHPSRLPLWRALLVIVCSEDGQTLTPSCMISTSAPVSAPAIRTPGQPLRAGGVRAWRPRHRRSRTPPFRCTITRTVGGFLTITFPFPKPPNTRKEKAHFGKAIFTPAISIWSVISVPVHDQRRQLRHLLM